MSAWSVVTLPGGTLCASGGTCVCGQEYDHKYDAALCGPKADTTLVREAVKYCKSMILDDITDGLVPKDVKSFEELHDYVDANDYFIEALGTDVDFDELIETANQVQAQLDEWIKAGF